MNATHELTGQDRAMAAMSKLEELIREIDLAATEEDFPLSYPRIYQLRDDLIAAKESFESDMNFKSWK